MASWKDLYNQPIMSAKRLGKRVIKGAISSIAPEEINGNGKESQTKLVITIGTGDERFAINKTNAQALAKAYGEDYTGWEGKRVEISSQPTTFAGENTFGIEIKPIGK